MHKSYSRYSENTPFLAIFRCFWALIFRFLAENINKYDFMLRIMNIFPVKKIGEKNRIFSRLIGSKVTKSEHF